MDWPKVSLLILPFDNNEFFVRAVESLISNTDYPWFEVIASHNPCDDQDINAAIKESCEIFAANHERFLYKVNSENLYHGPGLMKGFEITNPESKYIGLLNDDIFVPGYSLDWLKKMVSFLEKDPTVATVTPSLYHLKNTVYWMGRKKNGGTHDYLHMPKGDPSLPTEPLVTSYNNMAFCLTRRFLLEEIPLGQTCPFYGSDSEFASRIKDAHPTFTHWVLPKVQIYHENIYYLRTTKGKDPVTSG